MFVPYNEKYNQENIERCMEKHLYDAPVWYAREYVTLEEKNGKYYIYLSLPASAIGYSRYRRTWRLYFCEKGIRVVERLSFFSFLMFLFFIPVMCVCTFGTLITGEILMSVMAFGILVLSVWLFGIKTKKNLKDFLGGKMQD